MPGSAKQRIFFAFFALFAAYSIYVWTAGTEKMQAVTPDLLAMTGMALYQEKNCTACHQFYGLGGHMGPDLTNVISAPDKGADYARVFIEYGTVKMPNYGFSESEINALISFLKYVDSSGTYPDKNMEIKWYGTVVYNADTKTE